MLGKVQVVAKVETIVQSRGPQPTIVRSRGPHHHFGQKLEQREPGGVMSAISHTRRLGKTSRTIFGKQATWFTQT